MLIRFSPQRRDDPMVVSKVGDELTINGETFDFSTLPDGATIPEGEVPCASIVGAVDRVAGELQLTLLLPHNATPNACTTFPEPLTVTVDGPVDIPFDAVTTVTEAHGVRRTVIKRWHQADIITEEPIEGIADVGA